MIIGFSRPVKKSFHGWLIEKIDDSTFDHAYLRFTLNKFQRDIVCQSIDVGVQLVSQTEFLSKSTPVEEYELIISDDQFISMVQFCIDNAGKEYSLWGVIGEGFVKLAAKINWKIKNPFDSKDKSYFFSELVTQCLDTIDPKDFNLNADNISPMDLNTIIKSMNLKRVL
jgi:hypothetical protein